MWVDFLFLFLIKMYVDLKMYYAPKEEMREVNKALSTKSSNP